MPFLDPEDGADLPDELVDVRPSLALVRRFVETARHCPWFTALGNPPGRTVHTVARRYLDNLGFPDVTLTPLSTWDDATDAAQSLDWDTASWEAEEQLRAALTAEAVDLLGEEALDVALTYVASEVTAPIRLGVDTAAGLWNVRDTGIVNAAAGAAVQACHLAALSLVVGQADPDHPFTAKFELFEAGRWPVGIAGSSFNLF